MPEERFALGKLMHAAQFGRWLPLHNDRNILKRRTRAFRQAYKFFRHDFLKGMFFHKDKSEEYAEAERRGAERPWSPAKRDERGERIRQNSSEGNFAGSAEAYSERLLNELKLLKHLFVELHDAARFAVGEEKLAPLVRHLVAYFVRLPCER